MLAGDICRRAAGCAGTPSLKQDGGAHAEQQSRVWNEMTRRCKEVINFHKAFRLGIGRLEQLPLCRGSCSLVWRLINIQRRVLATGNESMNAPYSGAPGNQADLRALNQ